MRHLPKIAALGFVFALASCLLPEYSVDESMGGTGGTTPDLPQLPPKPDGCGDPKDGPAMVPVPGGYCIDSTEVTWRQYTAWAFKASTAGQPEECDWNDTFIPPAEKQGCTVSLETNGDLRPVVCVDWCDATAYCKAMGKRLCGKIGGGSPPMQDYKKPDVSQWMNACSSGGRNDFPYGKVFEASACQALGTDSAQTTAVQTKLQCQSTVDGYEGVFDLSGNVAEWEDSCNGTFGTGDACLVRGGSFKESEAEASCGVNRTAQRNTAIVQIGFRCCWDPK